MKYEFSLAHLTILCCSPPDLIEIASEAGYDYVSLRPIAVTPNEPKYPLGDDPHLLRQTKSALAAAGMRVLDIEVARIVPELNVKTYRPVLEAAANLGARHVLSSGWSSGLNYVCEKFAERCDLTVDLEFVTFAAIGTLADAVAIIRSAARDNGGVCIDTLHFFRLNTQLTQLDTLPRSWFRFMQLCDALMESPTRIDELIVARAPTEDSWEKVVSIWLVLSDACRHTLFAGDPELEIGPNHVANGHCQKSDCHSTCVPDRTCGGATAMT